MHLVSPEDVFGSKSVVVRGMMDEGDIEKDSGQEPGQLQCGPCKQIFLNSAALQVHKTNKHVSSAIELITDTAAVSRQFELQENPKF